MENVDWRHLTTGSSGLTGQARSQLNRMLEYSDSQTKYNDIANKRENCNSCNVHSQPKKSTLQWKPIHSPPPGRTILHPVRLAL